MKVVNHKKDKRITAVGDVETGSVVRFTRKLCDYPLDNLYLVLHVCGSYADNTEYGCATGKIGVANLENGKLSFIVPTRAVTIMKAEVGLNGPRN